MKDSRRCCRVGRGLLLGALLLLTAGALHGAKGPAPAWLKSVAATPEPTPARDADAVVLHDESVQKVDADGKIVTSVHGAVRVLRRDGRDAAMVHFSYNDKSEKVMAFEAWLIQPSGAVKSYTRKDVLDAALDRDAVYTDARAMVLSAEAEAEVGSVFGFTYVLEERSIFSQRRWHFQGSEPVALSRFTVELPRGWSLRATTFNHAGIEPRVDGLRHTWELRDLPAVQTEPLGPSPMRQGAAVGIDLQPPVDGKTRTLLRTFASWPDVSAYIAELHDSRAVADASVAAKAAELTAGAVTTWEKIRAIARYAQSVNYASIQLGSGRGGGYTPNPAPEVLRRNYGDCKDKTILMRALLAAVGVRSYSTIAYWGDRAAVIDLWPSPQQFNHCIVAVAADDSVQSSAVIAHPELGRLLIVDPTDDATAPGSLDYAHQGSLVLIGAGTPHDLVRLPMAPAEENRLVRRIAARMDATGAIAATITENFTGQEAAGARREFRRTPTKVEYTRVIERWVSRGARAAHVSSVTTEDRPAAGEFFVAVEFVAPAYAQSMQGQLLVFKPAVLSRRSHHSLTATRRTLPVILEPNAFEETLDLELPPEFVVDEIGSPVDLVRPWGLYQSTAEVVDGRLHFRRSLVMRAAEIPVAEYATVRSFFEGIVRAEQTPVVLKRK